LGPTAKNLRIRDIKAKGQYAEALQAKFDAIIRKAEFKLLDAATHAGPARVTKLHCNVFKNGGGIRNFREKTGDE